MADLTSSNTSTGDTGQRDSFDRVKQPYVQGHHPIPRTNFPPPKDHKIMYHVTGKWPVGAAQGDFIHMHATKPFGHTSHKIYWGRLPYLRYAGGEHNNLNAKYDATGGKPYLHPDNAHLPIHVLRMPVPQYAIDALGQTNNWDEDEIGTEGPLQLKVLGRQIVKHTINAGWGEHERDVHYLDVVPATAAERTATPPPPKEITPFVNPEEDENERIAQRLARIRNMAYGNKGAEVDVNLRQDAVQFLAKAAENWWDDDYDGRDEAKNQPQIPESSDYDSDRFFDGIGKIDHRAGPDLAEAMDIARDHGHNVEPDMHSINVNSIFGKGTMGSYNCTNPGCQHGFDVVVRPTHIGSSVRYTHGTALTMPCGTDPMNPSLEDAKSSVEQALHHYKHDTGTGWSSKPWHGDRGTIHTKVCPSCGEYGQVIESHQHPKNMLQVSSSTFNCGDPMEKAHKEAYRKANDAAT